MTTGFYTVNRLSTKLLVGREWMLYLISGRYFLVLACSVFIDRKKFVDQLFKFKFLFYIGSMLFF